MLKATTSAFAAALLAASCGMATAQGAGTDKTEGSEAGPGRPALLQSSQATSSPQSNKMQQKKSSLSMRRTGTKAWMHAGRMRQPIR